MRVRPLGASGGVVSGMALALALISGCGVGVTSFCKPDPGEIVFGNDRQASNDALGSCSKTFKQEGDFAFVGLFPREVTGTVAMEVVKDAEPPRRAGSGFSFDQPGDFWSGLWHLSDLPGPGHYVVRMVLGTEVLATGEFDLTQ